MRCTRTLFERSLYHIQANPYHSCARRRRRQSKAVDRCGTIISARAIVKKRRTRCDRASEKIAWDEHSGMARNKQPETCCRNIEKNYIRVDTGRRSAPRYYSQPKRDDKHRTQTRLVNVRLFFASLCSRWRFLSKRNIAVAMQKARTTAILGPTVCETTRRCIKAEKDGQLRFGSCRSNPSCTRRTGCKVRKKSLPAVYFGYNFSPQCTYSTGKLFTIRTGNLLRAGFLIFKRVGAFYTNLLQQNDSRISYFAANISACLSHCSLSNYCAGTQ